MNQSENIFLLIKSLSKSEKRYFKVFAALNSKQRNQVILFNAIDSLKENDDQQLKTLLKGNSFVKRLSSEKVYLFNLILKCLRFYHSGSSVTKQIKERIVDIETLFEKILIKACYNLLKKTIHQAIEIEEYNTVIELLSLQLRYVRNSVAFREVCRESYTEVYELRGSYMEKLRELDLLKDASWKIYEVYSRHGQIAEEILKKELRKITEGLPLEKDLLSNESRSEYFYILSMDAYMRDDIKTAIRFTLQSLGFFKEKVVARTEYLSRRYMSILNNLIVFCIRNKNFNTATESIQRMKTFQMRKNLSSVYIESYKYLFASLHELEILIQKDDAKKTGQVLSLCAVYLEKYRKALTAAAYNAVLFVLASSFFMARNFKKSLHYINQLDQAGFDSFEKIQKLGLLNLITHYELGNFELVKSLSKRYRGEFLRKKRNEESILYFIELFKVLQKPKASKTEKQEAVNKAVKKVLGFMKKSGQEEREHDHYSFLKWLQEIKTV